MIAALAFVLAMTAPPLRAETRVRFDSLQYQIEVLTGAGSPSIPLEAARIPEPRSSAGVEDPRKVKEWTVLLFFNGKNNLSEDLRRNLRDAAQFGSSGRIDVVAEAGEASMDAAGWKTTRYHLAPGGAMAPLVLSSDPWSPPNEDMGNAKRLADFVVWAKLRYPAKRYLLVVGGHGMGWRGLSPDDQTGHEMKVQELREALHHVGAIDVLSTDACMMQMAEVAYELKDEARIIVGSEEIIPGPGNAYTRIIRALSENPAMGPEDAGRLLVEAYGQAYAASNKQVTLSALDGEKMPLLRQAVDRWIAAVASARESGVDSPDVLMQAWYRVQRFHDPFFVDLEDFVQKVSAASRSPEVAARGAEVARLIDDEIILSRAQRRLGNARGLSVSLDEKAGDGYSALSWYRESRWKDVLAWLPRF